MKKFALTAVAVFTLSSCGGASTSDTTVASDTTAIASTADTEKFTLTVGENSGEAEIITFTQGSNVELTIINPDADDEVHLHGYDLTTGDLAKGDKGVISFVADKAGDFEVESHVSEEVLSIIRITK
jgi:hypothetical protein